MPVANHSPWAVCILLRHLQGEHNLCFIVRYSPWVRTICIHWVRQLVMSNFRRPFLFCMWTVLVLRATVLAFWSSSRETPFCTSLGGTMGNSCRLTGSHRAWSSGSSSECCCSVGRWADVRLRKAMDGWHKPWWIVMDGWHKPWWIVMDGWIQSSAPLQPGAFTVLLYGLLGRYTAPPPHQLCKQCLERCPSH